MNKTYYLVILYEDYFNEVIDLLDDNDIKYQSNKEECSIVFNEIEYKKQNELIEDYKKVDDFNFDVEVIKRSYE